MNGMSELIELFDLRGTDQYGGEAVSQLAHSLQCAALAERDGAPPALIAAALLHDVGHLLAKHADEHGDDRHEDIGHGYLSRLFGPDVAEPVRLHVAAKRYLCSIDPGYFELLSPASVRSLRLQGGPLSPVEVAAYERSPHATAAASLRRWDDQAKIPDLPTRTFASYSAMLAALAR